MGRMMSQVICAIFRAGEIIAGGVVLATMAYYVHVASVNGEPVRTFSAQYLFSICLAAASILIALLLLFPSNYTFRHFPLDLLISLAWFVAFAFLLIDFQHKSCDPDVHNFATLALGGGCNTARAAFGFAFLGGCFWAITFAVGFWVTTRERRLKRLTSTPTTTGGG